MAGRTGSFRSTLPTQSFSKGDTMTMTEMAVYEMDTMLADGASWAEYESFLDDLIGAIEDSES